MRTKTLALPALALLFATTTALAQPKPDAVPPAPSTTAAPTGSSASAADIVAKMQKFYESVGAYEADFTQQYVLKAFGQTKTSSGHVLFVKPGKMRWDYTDPKDNVVVSDGTTLWSYTASEKQARKMLVKDSQMPTALAFLTGKGDLTKSFDFTLAVGMKMDGGYVLEGKPKEATNLYSKVYFYVDGETYQALRVLMIDGQDNRNRFTFDKPKVNMKVDDGRFKWSPPAGAAVTTN